MFYDKFKQLCVQKGVSCNRAAAEIGLSNATPTSWKKRGLTPKGDTLTKIADYFGVTTDFLLSDETTGPDENGAPLANAIFNASRVTASTPNENAVIADITYDILANKKAPTQTDGRELPHAQRREVIAGNGISIMLDADAKLTEAQLEDIINFIEFQQRKYGK